MYNCYLRILTLLIGFRNGSIGEGGSVLDERGDCEQQKYTYLERHGVRRTDEKSVHVDEKSKTAFKRMTGLGQTGLRRSMRKIVRLRSLLRARKTSAVRR